MSLDHLYISTFSTRRPVVTQNQLGAGAEVFSTNISSFKGRLQKRSNSTEGQESGRITELSDFNLYCGPSNDINATDRVVFGTRSFEVVTVDDANQLGNHLKVELLEIV
jgi:head-tail adaptor